MWGIDDLVDIIEAYRQRNFDDDMTIIKEKFEGEEGIAQKLKTSLSDGLLGNDFAARDRYFGSNQKAPPTRTGFWTLFMEGKYRFR